MNIFTTKKAFSLIELLVVIFIITVLAAILFPVFAQVKEKTRSTQCLSNIKQIGTAFFMYTEDSDGYYPVVPIGEDFLNISDSEIYCGHLPLSEDNKEALSQISFRKQIEMYTKNFRIFVCPSDNSIIDKTGAYTPGKRFSSYHYRHYIGVQISVIDEKEHDRQYFKNWPAIWSENTIEHPSQTYIFHEIEPFHLREEKMPSSLESYDIESISDESKFNMVFADGHAATYRAVNALFWQAGPSIWDYHWPKHHDGTQLEYSTTNLWDVE